MFGLFEDKKKQIQQNHELSKNVSKLSDIVLIKYFLVKEGSQTLIQKSGLDSFDRNLYECSYILGIVMGAKFYLLGSDKILEDRDMLEICFQKGIKYNLFEDFKRSEIFFKFVHTYNHFQEIQTLSAKGFEATNFYLAAKNTEGMSEEAEQIISSRVSKETLINNLEKHINFDHFEEKDLIQKFINLSKKSLFKEKIQGQL